MEAQSIQVSTLEKLEEKLKNVLEDFSPSLAIVFSSVVHNQEDLAQLFSRFGIEVFGVTTNGEFINEHHQKGTIATLLLDMAQESFQILQADFQDRNFREVATSVAQETQARFTDPAFLIGISHMETDGEQVLRGFEDVFGRDVNIFGGSAGDDYRMKQTFVYTSKVASDCGMICLAFDQSKIKVEGIATCGWKAVGTEKTITKSEGNHVFTVDNIPVVDITAKFGGLDNVSPDNDRLWVDLACNLPLQVQRENGDPVMRGGLVIDWEDRSYYTSGSVPQGAKVRFSLPPDWDVMDEVVQGVEALKVDRMPKADGVVVFSCAGRTVSLGPLMSEEIEGIKNVWKVPMVGTFCNGELGRGPGGNLEMHNLTTCCIALKEI